MANGFEDVLVPPQVNAITYDVGKDYAILDKEGGSSPSWCLAVFRLGTPITYSRLERKSISSISPIDGVMSRKEGALIITGDCLQINVNNAKDSCTKNLSAVLKGTTNYLSSNAILPGDWIMGWMHTNPNDTQKVINALNKGEAANWFESGFKFLGRVHDIRKRLNINPNGLKDLTYSLTAVGFDELSSIFFYDQALAIAESQDIFQFLAFISQNVNDWICKLGNSAGQIKDNAEVLVTSFLDLILGKTEGNITNLPSERLGLEIKPSPQISKEAPYAYLVPVSVATTLGRTIIDNRKGTENGHQSFGYSDLLTVLSGVQKYTPKDEPNHHGFVPEINFKKSKSNRLNCFERIKGTYIPIENCFINISLWGLLHQFKNPTTNEIYTCIRPDTFGSLMPSLVFRQQPFSSNAIQEDQTFPLTRFLSLPRWKIPGAMITNLDFGRSNSTHWNFVHVYGNVNPYNQESEYSLALQMLHNPPIADTVDISRSGMKPFMSTVNQSLEDVQIPGRGRIWMEAIADWNFGLQYSLNGSASCYGIQSPISEGDNVEIDGIAFHVDSLSHSCGITGESKYFYTTLNLTHGMPVDQQTSNSVAPRYPGFKAIDFNDLSKQAGDDSIAVGFNPGITKES